MKPSPSLNCLSRALAALALLVPYAAGGQEVAGVTWDGEAGGPVAGAAVLVLSDDGRATGHPGTLSDASGRFRLNLAGLSLPVVVVAQKSGFGTSTPFTVSEDPGASGPLNALLELRSLIRPQAAFTVTDEGASVSPGAGRILGWVRERDTGRPIPTAEVRVLEGGPATLTDDNGMFVLSGVLPGETALGITHISFSPEGHFFRVEAGRNYEVQVAMSPDAIPIEGVEVTARSQTWFRQMDGMRLRMRQGIRGDFVTAAQLESRGYPPVQEAIRALPSVQVIQRGPHGVDLRFRSCEMQPVVFVDGIQVNEPEDGEPLWILRELPGMDVEAIEVYRGPGSVPAEFSGPDAMCGALIIWTKR